MKPALFAFGLAAALLSSAAAQDKGLNDPRLIQPEDFSGYCSEDWKGEEVCWEESKTPWKGPELETALANILAPAAERSADFASRHRCSAIVIAPDWALTAAHCVDGGNVAGTYSVAIGFAGRYSGDAPRHGVILPVRRVVLHPEYRKKGVDLALVQFAEDPEIHIDNPTLSPGAGQFPRTAETTFPPAGAPPLRFADITGRGMSDEYDSFLANAFLFRWSRIGEDQLALASTPLFPISHAFCEQQRQRGDPKIPKSVYCGLTHDRPLCPEDSGAPVMSGDGISADAYVPSELLVVAIATRDRKDCAPEGEPGWFTPVGPHRAWIRDVVRESYQKRIKESVELLGPAAE